MNHIYRHTLSLLTAAEKRRFFLLVALDVLITVLDLLFLGLLLLVVGHYTQALPPGTLPSWLTDAVNGHPLFLIGSFLLLFALKNLLGIQVFRKQFHFIYNVATRLSLRMLRQYLNGSFSDYVHTDSSVQVRKISQQTVEFSHHVLRGWQQVISNSILVGLTVIAIILFDAYLFGLLLLMLLPAIFIVVLITRNRLSNIRRTLRMHRERTMQYLNEALAGFMEANVYQRKDFFISRYAVFQEKYNADLARQQVMLGLPARMMEVFAVFGLFLLVVINTYLLQSESLLLLIGAFMAAAYKIIPGVVRILNHLQQIRIYGAGIEDLERTDIPQPATNVQEPGKLEQIEVDRLYFAFNETPLLSGISFRLEGGTLTGLSAPSGKGKTTLVSLLLGFLEPRSGNIFFNDHSTTAELRKTYWPRISYIKQQSFLLHDSIQHNIALTETPDMKALWRAVTETGLHGFVSSAEQGLDTVIRENGKNISGGQRQRMMLARALYRDADLYILDEPFGELDRESRTGLLGHLRTLTDNGKMVLLITHDEELLQSCSKIIRFNER